MKIINVAAIGIAGISMAAIVARGQIDMSIPSIGPKA
jgi:ribose/xylose/arabinose/galactoside ABC-type transport system permease subunit